MNMRFRYGLGDDLCRIFVHFETARMKRSGELYDKFRDMIDLLTRMSLHI